MIFDLDGCLIESEVICLTTLADMLNEAGFARLTWGDLRDEFMGMSITRICETLAVRDGLPVPPDLVVRFEDRVCDAFRSSLSLMEGAGELLESLAQQGLPMAIATGAPLRRMQLALRLTGIHDYFPGTACSSDEVTVGKPGPDLYFLAARRMGVAPRSCAAIDDSPNGIRGARAAGMIAYGFVGGAHLAQTRKTHSSELLRLGAKEVIQSLTGFRPEFGDEQPRDL